MPRWRGPGPPVTGSVLSEVKAGRGGGKETGGRGEGAVVAEAQGSLLQSLAAHGGCRGRPGWF